MKISRKYRKSAPEIRRFSVRRKISKPGDLASLESTNKK